ncbi:hypothetical protein, partial [Nocardioides sp. XL1]|uniref:hypothetical protein n=1 Tax=Nocardioides sp. XL1 TaxID=2003120 RepID=UPI001A908AD6
STCRTHRSLTAGSIFFGMVRILPTQKDAASNLGRFMEPDGTFVQCVRALGPEALTHHKQRTEREVSPDL